MKVIGRGGISSREYVFLEFQRACLFSEAELYLIGQDGICWSEISQLCYGIDECIPDLSQI